MRIRTIKPEWLEDDRLLTAGSDARVLSIALILLSDDYGRGRLSIATAARVFPESPEKFRDSLARLSGWFVGVYEVRGQQYFQVLNWAKHQKVDKPGKPQVPEPPEGFFSDDSEHSRDSREGVAKVPESLAPDLGPRTVGPGPWTGSGSEPAADANQAQPVQEPPPPQPGSLGAILATPPAVRPSPPPPAAPDGPCQLPEFTEATIRAVRKQVHDLYTAKVGYSHDLNGKHVERLTQTLRGVAHARGEALPVVVERAVTGFLADTYWQKARWPLNGLVSQAARYADPTKPEDIVVVDHGKNQAKLSSLRSKLSAAETERKLAASMNPSALAKIDQRIDGMRREVKRLEGAA